MESPYTILPRRRAAVLLGVAKVVVGLLLFLFLLLFLRLLPLLFILLLLRLLLVLLQFFGKMFVFIFQVFVLVAEIFDRLFHLAKPLEELLRGGIVRVLGGGGAGECRDSGSVGLRGRGRRPARQSQGRQEGASSQASAHTATLHVVGVSSQPGEETARLASWKSLVTTICLEALVEHHGGVSVKRMKHEHFPVPNAASSFASEQPAGPEVARKPLGAVSRWVSTLRPHRIEQFCGSG